MRGAAQSRPIHDFIGSRTRRGGSGSGRSAARRQSVPPDLRARPRLPGKYAGKSAWSEIPASSAASAKERSGIAQQLQRSMDATLEQSLMRRQPGTPFGRADELHRPQPAGAGDVRQSNPGSEANNGPLQRNTRKRPPCRVATHGMRSVLLSRYPRPALRSPRKRDPSWMPAPICMSPSKRDSTGIVSIPRHRSTPFFKKFINRPVGWFILPDMHNFGRER
jgi:hypothetical protein